MKGMNELKINQSTMQEAMEYWLHQKVFQAGNKPRVISVEKDPQDFSTNGFIVKLDCSEVEDADK